MRVIAKVLLAVPLLLSPAIAAPQDNFPVLVASVAELSGHGAVAGTNFNNGVLMAFDEINGAGGILGRKIEVVSLDTKSRPDVAKAAIRKAREMNVYAILGPVLSDTTLASMAEIHATGIPAFIGAEAARITLQGNPYIFRTSLSQTAAMRKLARYLKESAGTTSVAIVWVNDEDGKAGRDAMARAMEAEDIQLAADLPTEPGETDFAGLVRKIKQSNANTTFIYLNDEESARCLRELHDQAYGGWIVGETTLVSQNVLQLSGEIANGVRAHVSLTPNALAPPIKAFNKNFLKSYGYQSDDNGMKGYIAGYILKAVTEKIGKFNSQELAHATRGVRLSASLHPGILLDVRYGENGDLDRASFIVGVMRGRQEFITMLPAMGINF